MSWILLNDCLQSWVEELEKQYNGQPSNLNIGNDLIYRFYERISYKARKLKSYQILQLLMDESNGNWKKFRSLLAHHYNYKEFRKRVFKRDKKCIFCKSKKNLHLHHIQSVVKRPDLIFNLDNCITLCRSCHMKEFRKQIYA